MPASVSHGSPNLDAPSESTERIEVTFEYHDPAIVNSVEQADEIPVDMSKLQRQCDDFKHIITYLESSIVPENKDLAKLVTVVAENQYVLNDGILYHVFKPRTKKLKQTDQEDLI